MIIAEVNEEVQFSCQTKYTYWWKKNPSLPSGVLFLYIDAILTKQTKTFAFDLGCLFLNPTFKSESYLSLNVLKASCAILTKSTTLDASGKLFHTLNKSSWSYKTPKGKAVPLPPCIVGCLLPNLRPLKGQHNERHGCRCHLINVKSPGHMKGEREIPRRPPLSSLTADLSELALSPPPWHVWNVCYVLGNWKQQQEECGEGDRGSSCMEDL